MKGAPLEVILCGVEGLAVRAAAAAPEQRLRCGACRVPQALAVARSEATARQLREYLGIAIVVAVQLLRGWRQSRVEGPRQATEARVPSP